MNLKEKLKECKYDFMHFLIKYYKLYKEEGLQDLPGSIKQSIKSYRKEIDSVKTFCDESLIKTNNTKDCVLVTELFTYHNIWSENKLNMKEFGKRIKLAGFDIGRPRVNGVQGTAVMKHQWNVEYKSSLQQIDNEL